MAQFPSRKRWRGPHSASVGYRTPCVARYSTLNKSLLQDELPRLPVIAFDKALAEQQRSGVMDQRGTPADHGAVVFGRKLRKIIVAEQLARGHRRLASGVADARLAARPPP